MVGILETDCLNNLAWGAAVNGQHYEEALELAQRAIFVEPDSVSYRDTLAEVLFRLGRIQQAIVVEENCVVDSPDEWHLHEQLERFQNEQPD